MIFRVFSPPELYSAKICLAKNTGSPYKKRQRLIYEVWIAEGDVCEDNLKLVLVATNRNKLVITGLKRDIEYSISVSLRNARGRGELAGKVKFIAS